MRRGVALLVTIGFLVIMTTLIGYMFSISQRNFKELSEVQSKNQSSVIFDDVRNLLDSYVRDIKDSSDLDIFLLGTPPFYDEKSKLSLRVGIKPLSNKININSLLIKKNINKEIETLINNICETYNVLDPSLLTALILDTIDEDDISREALSEISLEDIKFSNSLVVDMKHFKKIVDYYIQATQDRNIKDVPWSRLIYFGDNKKSILDCDRLTPELINALSLDADSFNGCESLDDEEGKRVAKKYNLKQYDKKSSYIVEVSIYYQVDKIEDSLTFKYDLHR